MANDVATAPPHVLVVEDDDINRTLIRLVLEQAGYVVEEAAEGKRALERLRASQEGLVVLLDLVMPVTDGVQVLQAVVAEEALVSRNAYILVTASMDATSTTVEALRARVQVPLLSKPFDIDRLVEIVAEAAERLT